MTTLADIFQKHGADYCQQYREKMLYSHLRVLRAVVRCRTPALGGHVYHCPDCDEVEYRYHSCRNRHCPQCQQGLAQQWLARQQALLLPAPYFLLTFTLPASLRRLARQNQKLIYNLLFRTAATATQKLAHDPRFVGGQIGMVGILHTWARDLSYHPHVHFLVPAGGLDRNTNCWRSANDSFLVPVKALSPIFRAKFRDALQQTDLFDQVPAALWQQDWVVHCQPVGNGRAALKYLAPYVFRVALSNNRIVKLADGHVTFRYTASATGETKFCTLPVFQFMHRFLQHVLPKGFVKVRYYGLFSAGNRQLLYLAWRSLLTQLPGPLPILPPQPMPNTAFTCPHCGQAMRLQATLKPGERAPP
jgi:hypothetical protein